MGEDRTPNGVGSRLAYGAIAHSKSQCPPFACDWNPWNDFGFIFLSDELCDIFRCFAISYKSRIVRRNGTILEVSLALKDPVLEVTHGIGYFLKSGLALKNVFICVAEIRVLLVADKLHRSSVETIAAYMLLAPTYDLHVVQFYESVVR